MLQKQFLQKVLTRYITTLMYFLSHHKNRRSTSDLETAEFPHCAECSENPSSSHHCTVLRDVTRLKGKETDPEASVHVPISLLRLLPAASWGWYEEGRGLAPSWGRRNGGHGKPPDALLSLHVKKAQSHPPCTTGLWLPPGSGACLQPQPQERAGPWQELQVW